MVPDTSPPIRPQRFPRSWEQTIRVSYVGLDTFEQRRDAMVAKLRASRWVKEAAFSYLGDLVEELAEQANGDDFDDVMGAIYDEADDDRVWIEVQR